MMENDSPTAATKVSSSFKKKQWAVALDVTMSKTASMSSLDGAVFASGGDKKQQHTSITSNTVPHEVWVLHILKKTQGFMLSKQLEIQQSTHYNHM